MRVENCNFRCSNQLRGVAMLDFAFLGLVVLFFGCALAYAAWLETLHTSTGD